MKKDDKIIQDDVLKERRLIYKIKPITSQFYKSVLSAKLKNNDSSDIMQHHIYSTT
jgi:hypothetical protein